MRLSQVARTGSETAGPMAPPLSCSIVRAASVSAGLAPGKNLRAPNHRNTTPRPIRRTGTPSRARAAVIRTSMRLERVGKAGSGHSVRLPPIPHSGRGGDCDARPTLPRSDVGLRVQPDAGGGGGRWRRRADSNR